MAKKDSGITGTDQFCGAGGSSSGAEKAGVKITQAMNHWKLATETHNANFPDADHDCTDIQACDPRRYRPTNILITSPECTNHTLLKGQKAVKSQMDLFASGKMDAKAERSRATMWDVPRFAEVHNYELIFVENVVEAKKWVMFEAWLMAMHLLGYKHECVYFNSQFAYPTPQSRDRLYIVFWKKGNKKPNLNFTPKAFCHYCGKDVDSVQTWKDGSKPYGKYKKQYVYCCPVCTKIVRPYYYAAFNCIDWSIPGRRIGDMNIAENSMKRIQYGYDRYGNKPFITINKYSSGMDCRVKNMEDSLPTLVGSPPNPFIINPFMFTTEHTKAGNASYVWDSVSTLRTQTTTQSVGAVMPPNNPFIGTIDTSLTPDQMAINKAGIISGERLNSFFSYYYGGSNQASHITDAVCTLPCKGTAALVNQSEGAKLEDCTYRMLKAHEVKLGMAFDPDYIILGNIEEQIKQCGNAVTPPVMEMLVERGLETLK